MLTTEAAAMVTMGQRAWQFTPEQFAAAWNSGATPDEAVAAVQRLGDGPVPRWAVRARSAELLKAGIELKDFAAKAA